MEDAKKQEGRKRESVKYVEPPVTAHIVRHKPRPKSILHADSKQALIELKYWSVFLYNAMETEELLKFRMGLKQLQKDLRKQNNTLIDG